MSSIRLVCQWYRPRDPVRKLELDLTRKMNSGRFATCDYLEGWLTFGDLVKHCNAKYPGDLCVIANADVTLWPEMLRNYVVDDRSFVALTPWDNINHPRFLGHQCGDKIYSGSQDAWAFIASPLPDVDVDIPMGHIGCDQLIVGWAVRKKLDVRDPCFDIRLQHTHSNHSAEPNGRPPLLGYFGYPEMGNGGTVIAHQWNGDGVFNWELHECPR